MAIPFARSLARLLFTVALSGRLPGLALAFLTAVTLQASVSGSYTSSFSGSTLGNYFPPPPLSLPPPPKVRVDRSIVWTTTALGTHSLSESITLTAESDTIWTLASNQPWLVPDRTEGSGTATVRLDFTPAELPLGRHEATLALRSGEEETNIPVTLSVAPLALRMLFDAPGTPRAYAVSQTGGEWTSAMLLEIDASDGRILRSVSLPTISGLVWHVDDGLLYISHYYSKYISVLAPGSLAWVRTLNFDSLAADTPFPQVDCPQRLYAGRRGRLLAEFASKIYGQPKVLRWLDSTTGKILATRKTEPEADIAFHASSGTGYNGGWFYLSTDTFSGAFPSDYVRVRDAQFISSAPAPSPASIGRAGSPRPLAPPLSSRPIC